PLLPLPRRRSRRRAPCPLPVVLLVGFWVPARLNPSRLASRRHRPPPLVCCRPLLPPPLRLLSLHRCYPRWVGNPYLCRASRWRQRRRRRQPPRRRTSPP
ncbi:unnamed protein product, partial [Ectocarpus sp. 8 AP-2014]